MGFFFLWGLFLWFVGTLAFRLVGQFILVADRPFLLLLTFAATVPVMAAAIYPIYSRKKISPSRRPLAAIFTVLPGMVLDVFSVLFFPVVFPNLAPSAVVPFSAILLWGYSILLLTSFLPQLEIADNTSSSFFNENPTISGR
jgi:hypothetical protein